ncbi:hypothetical protein M2325_000678 [Methanococcus voltae PS]|uniref:Tetratricopeptide repeat protein n=1 Tax=Methanococcus voltae PS TaxID=523842 RepID=A0ABT2EVK4_METVO|nr:hypothetical protein [Methanococcus voltae]MCS3921993.1 hypothetical protein [Methanococcus voltae PS]
MEKYDELLKLQPSNESAVTGKVRIMMKYGKYEEARNLINNHNYFNTFNLSIQFYNAILYFLDNNTQKSKEIIQKMFLRDMTIYKPDDYFKDVLSNINYNVPEFEDLYIETKLERELSKDSHTQDHCKIKEYCKILYEHTNKIEYKNMYENLLEKENAIKNEYYQKLEQERLRLEQARFEKEAMARKVILEEIESLKKRLEYYYEDKDYENFEYVYSILKDNEKYQNFVDFNYLQNLKNNLINRLTEDKVNILRENIQLYYLKKDYENSTKYIDLLLNNNDYLNYISEEYYLNLKNKIYEEETKLFENNLKDALLDGNYIIALNNANILYQRTGINKYSEMVPELKLKKEEQLLNLKKQKITDEINYLNEDIRKYLSNKKYVKAIKCVNKLIMNENYVPHIDLERYKKLKDEITNLRINQEIDILKEEITLLESKKNYKKAVIKIDELLKNKKYGKFIDKNYYSNLKDEYLKNISQKKQKKKFRKK